jgi:alanine racemase
VAEKPTRTATLPLGHADGISRAYGQGKGWVSVLGEKAPIIGNVCMDMMMVDVTGIPCEEGEVVTVFGTSPTAEELAGSAGTIPYELLTAISSRVKRKVIK